MDILRLRIIEGDVTTPEEIRALETQVLEQIKLECIDKKESILIQDLRKHETGGNIKNAIREHLSLYSYLGILKNNETWKGIALKLSYDQFSNNQNNMSKLSQNDIQLFEYIESEIYKILKCPNGWLSDLPSSVPQEFKEVEEFVIAKINNRESDIKRIKKLVIPKVFFILHQLLVDTGKISTCSDLAILATDDRYDLLKFFPEEDEKHLMLLITTSYARGIESKMNMSPNQ
jgi:hypothetical protein